MASKGTTKQKSLGEKKRNLWSKIQDRFLGNPSYWKPKVKKTNNRGGYIIDPTTNKPEEEKFSIPAVLFFKKNLNWKQRLNWVVWCKNNGLPDKYVLKWADLNGSCRDKYAREDILSLLNKCNNNELFKNQQWAWNIAAQRYTFLNGKHKF